jgi:hypothetical protein
MVPVILLQMGLLLLSNFAFFKNAEECFGKNESYSALK